jgi:hypothetical protein
MDPTPYLLFKFVEPFDTKSDYYPGNECHNHNANNDRHSFPIDGREQETSNQAVNESVAELYAKVEDDAKF